MTQALYSLRISVIAAILAFGFGLAAPAGAQVNPTASAVKEEQLLKALDHVSGRVSIPDQKAADLIKPQGKEWRDFHRSVMPTLGAVAILGMTLLVLVFYAKRGRIMIDSGKADRTITRFSGFERFVHWLGAGSFLILACSGLNITFGKLVLLPLMGEAAFSGWSQFAKFCHNYVSWAFMAGVLLMLLVWVRHNIPNGSDIVWLSKAGGLLGHEHPPAGKFNAGQKLIFWTVVISGALLTLSGLHLLFPNNVAEYTDWQFQQMLHGVVGVLATAAMIGHIYIGSVGMEGAIDAMKSGEVDLNWAREHHSLWVDEMVQKDPSLVHPKGTPAE